MATAPKFPLKLKHHGTGRERTVFSPADLVAAEFDGYSQGPKPKKFTETSRKAVAEQAAKANQKASQPQDAAGNAGKSTTTPADATGVTTK